MELRQLRYFVSAVRCGSVKGAALENHVSSPAVSVQLKQLEEELGEKLLICDRTGARLTHAGEIVRSQAEDILRRVDSLRQSMMRLRQGETGFLKMGNIDAAGIYVLPKVYAAFKKRFPGIDVQVVVSDSSRLLSALQRDEIELAVVTLPAALQAYVVEPIYNEELVAVAHPSHGLAEREPLDLKHIAQAGIITYPARSTTRGLIDRVFLERGLQAHALMEITSPEAMRELVEAGMGLSILPRPVVESALREGRLKRVRLKDVYFSRALGVAYRDPALLSPPARAFLRVLRTLPIFDVAPSSRLC